MNRKTKNIIAITLICMFSSCTGVSNFVMPEYVFAKETTENKDLNNKGAAVDTVSSATMLPYIEKFKETIGEAEKLCKNSVVGSNMGNYPKEVKDKLEKAIKDAKDMLFRVQSGKGINAELQQSDIYLKIQIENFKKGVITEKNAIVTKVENILLDKTLIELRPGEILKLNETVVPVNSTNKKVTWTSSNAAVAVVNEEGEIQALTLGEAIIRVTTEDGQKFAECRVNVKENDEVNVKDYTKVVNNTIDKITYKILEKPVMDWYILDLNKAGKEVPEECLKVLTKQIEGKTGLRRVTDCGKMVLNVLAAGGNPTNIGGCNLIEKIYNYDRKMGTNDLIFGLLALDANNFNIPNDAKCSREMFIETILKMKTNDNGWSFGGGKASVDMTAMAISALAPYYNSRNDVKDAVDGAVKLLSDKQNSDGGYESSNSLEMAIIALCDLGIDPVTDKRFIKNKNNLMDGLMGYKTEDGTGFGFQDNTYNAMATEQGLRALAAYKNFKENKGSVYKFNSYPNVVRAQDLQIKNITGVTEFKLGDDAKVIIQAQNNTDKNQDASLIIGLFSKDGRLIHYVVKNQTIELGKIVKLEAELKLPKEECVLKAFVWDSLEGMRSLSNVIEMKVVDIKDSIKETTIPTEISSAQTDNSTTIVLNVKRSLQGEYGDSNAFRVNGVNTNPKVTKVKISNNKITLILDKPIKKGEKVTVDYKLKEGSNLTYENGKNLEEFNECPITNTLKNITIMTYVDADNNVESYMLNDVKEMKKGLSDDPNLNVIALVDRMSGENTDILGEGFKDTRLYELGQNRATRIGGGAEFPEITTTSNYEGDMGDAHTLKKFIKFCKKNYQSDEYVLVILDHGAGTQGFSIDETSEDSNGDYSIMNIAEVSDVLTKDESVDLLVYEACLMGNAEVAYQYRPGNGSFEAKAMIASSPTMIAYGLKYDKIFRRLRSGGGNTGEEDYTLGGKELIYDPATISIEQLGGIILEEQNDSMSKFDDQVLAYYDLQKVSQVKKNVDELSKLLWKNGKKNIIDEIRGSKENKPLIMTYFESQHDEGEWMEYPYFDLFDLAEKIYNNYNNEFDGETREVAKNVMKAVDDFIVYSYAGKKYDELGFKEGKTGVSILLPDGNKYWQHEAWYTPNKLTDGNNYGKLQWCIDAKNKQINQVDNWFELLDAWYDKSNDSNGGVNNYQW